MNKNNSLIEKPESIFSKVINFFRKFFWKSNNVINNNIIKDEFTYKEKVENDISENNIQDLLDDEETILKRIETYDYYNNEIEFEDVDFENDDEIKMCNSEEEKKRFFNLYGKIKSRKINIQDADTIDLFKINLLLKEEEKLKIAKIEEQENILYKKKAI